MRIGISIKLDVTKIDENRLFKGQKGTYLDLTTFIDTDNPSQFGDHGFIAQSVSKEEREQGVQTPILGNTKVFYGLQNPGYQQTQPPQGNYQSNNQGNQKNQQQNQNQESDPDIPF